MTKMDLHTHSNVSDGTDSPAELVKKAKAAGLELVALTDHDTTAGVPEAVATGEEIGMRVLPGIEYDVEFDGVLHMLGLNIDITNGALIAAEERARVRREERNAEALRRLKAAGMDAAPYMEHGSVMVTRMHLARAIVKAGAAKTTNEAFEKYLRRGCVGNVPCTRPDYGTLIDIIHGAGGIAVLAHPCKLTCDVHPLIADMAARGLDGLEVFYPTATPGQVSLFSSLASQYGLLMTGGSDYHGEGRNVRLGDLLLFGKEK